MNASKPWPAMKQSFPPSVSMIGSGIVRTGPSLRLWRLRNSQARVTPLDPPQNRYLDPQTYRATAFPVPSGSAAIAGSFASDAAPDPDPLSIDEEHVPLDTPVCLLGNFDVAGGALVPGRGPLGRALHLYAGTRSEVLARLAGEVRGFGITAVIMVAIDAGLLAIPCLWAG